MLASCFPYVELHRYDDALVMTEAEPIIDHILSQYVLSPLDDEAQLVAGPTRQGC
jgi:hypothetical protein